VANEYSTGGDAGAAFFCRAEASYFTPMMKSPAEGRVPVTLPLTEVVVHFSFVQVVAS
jgi:hypothetical protein